jgi:hypothetical protein
LPFDHYKYASNNPVNRVDPYGKQDKPISAAKAQELVMWYNRFLEAIDQQDMPEATKDLHREAVKSLLIQRYIGATTGEKAVDVKLPRNKTAREIQFALVEKQITNARAGPQAKLLGAAGETALILEPAPAAGRTATSAGVRRAAEGAARRSLKAADEAVEGGTQVAVRRAVEEILEVDPRMLRYSQRSAGGRGRAEVLRESMKAHGYKGDPIDVVRLEDGSLVAIDNTRPAVAAELGINVRARVRHPSEPLPGEMIGRFGEAKTWGEALQYRTSHQDPPLPGTGASGLPRLPTPVE